MILGLRPLAAGNALQITHSFPAGATLCALMRKPTNDITGLSDPGALLVYEGLETIVVDAMPGLINEVPAFYEALYLVSGSWVSSPAVSGTPLASYADATTDVQGLVRDRIEAGMAVEVARGMFKPASGAITVLTAPPIENQTTWPVVTVQLESEMPGERGLGEMIEADVYDPLALNWIEHEGWLADVRLIISAWSLNSDERIELRKALRRVLIANFPVFDAAGMVEIVAQVGENDFINGEYSANVFQTNVTFSCKAPVIVTATAPVISSVTATPNGDVSPVI